MNPSRLYICVSKEQKGLIPTVREYLEKHFHKVLSDWRRNGGDSGDLGEEVAQLEQYRLSNGANLQLYTVLDHNTNGYAELISILFPELSTKETDDLVAFLDGHGFVSNHKHLRERPFGYKSFEPYLDDWYHAGRVKPFYRD